MTTTGLDSSYERRFGGVARLYGQAALARFRQAHVCVVGLGGVGSWAAEALVRSGIGRLTLIDFDDLCVSNTNRQLPALDGNYGKAKVEVLAQRFLQINPECRIEPIVDFIGAETFDAYLDRDYDFVVDAIDSLKAKVALIAECRRRKLPLIMSGGAGGQIDPTQVRVDDLARTTQDPLASKVRAQLRRDHGFARGDKKMGVPCVYSTEQLIYPQADGSVCAQKPEQGGARNCESGFGASLCVTGAFGFAAASFVLRSLAQKK